MSSRLGKLLKRRCPFRGELWGILVADDSGRWSQMVHRVEVLVVCDGVAIRISKLIDAGF